MLLQKEEINNSILTWLPRMSRSGHGIFIALILMLLLALSALPFLHVDISVRAPGITRPVQERTEIRPLISGIIDTLLCREGELIHKYDLILRMKDPSSIARSRLNQLEISQRKDFIHDLGLLTASRNPADLACLQLVSPVYKEQAGHFLQQLIEREAMLKKANKELEMNASLVKDKVISPKEYFDSQIRQETLSASCRSLEREQRASWEQDRVKYSLEYSSYKEQQVLVNANAGYYEIRAPVTGIVQGVNRLYQGSLLAAQERICTISPEGDLIGESYVPTSSIGLIRLSQPVFFQIDAFDYNYFGILKGRVIAIDNDFTLESNLPVFRVRCSFDSLQLYLRHGYTGRLKKGMSFQSRFVIGRRSLWQLLFDTVDDWLNPAAPTKQKEK